MSEMTVPKQTHGQKILGILRAKSLGLRAETLEAHHTSQDAQRFETVPKQPPTSKSDVRDSGLPTCGGFPTIGDPNPVPK